MGSVIFFVAKYMTAAPMISTILPMLRRKRLKKRTDSCRLLRGMDIMKQVLLSLK